MTARAAIPRKPPKELVEAIVDLKFDEDFYLNLSEKEQELKYKKQNNIIFDLSKKLGLDRIYVQDILDKHHAVQMPCYDCKQPKPGDREIICQTPLCLKCKERREYNGGKNETRN